MKQESYERYLELDFHDIRSQELRGAGILVSSTLGDMSDEVRAARRDDDVDLFLHIGDNGRATCFVGKIEMGQGIITSLAQMLADELDVAFESVDVVMADTDRCPWDMGTFGSRSTRFVGPPLRSAGAEARRTLIELAAEQLNVPVAQLVVENGVVIDSKNTDKRVSYSQLVTGKTIERRLKENVSVKSPSEFKIIGKAVKRSDAFEKVTGKALYAGDVRIPDMLYAKILRPPSHEATLLSVDTSAASTIEGIHIIEDGDLIAMLHPFPDEAEKALAKIQATFDVPETTVNDQTIFEHLLDVAPSGETVAEEGDLHIGEQESIALIEETYLDGYVAHAPIETHTALARVEGDKVTIWASTQTPFRARDEVAELLELPAENVRVITSFLGGGFGGKGNTQQILEAARLSKLTEKPVQVAWSREEEFFYDAFRPASVVTIRSGLDGAGQMSLWDYHVYFAGGRGAEHFYDIPHHRTLEHGNPWQNIPNSHPFATGAWRAPANNTNTFARESHLDIMAVKAGIDPLEFRLKHLKDEKMQRVLIAAAEQFGWAAAQSSDGRGYGIACGTDVGTYVATIAEVEVDKQSGKVKVTRVVAAQDMGLVINPEGARLQIESCVTMGLGYALTEDIRFQGGRLFDRNFDSYEIPRFSWLPKIEAVLIDDQNSPPQGGGEPVIITMGAVIANAVYDAIGVRLFQLPMTAERIRESLRKPG